MSPTGVATRSQCALRKWYRALSVSWRWFGARRSEIDGVQKTRNAASPATADGSPVKRLSAQILLGSQTIAYHPITPESWQVGRRRIGNGSFTIGRMDKPYLTMFGCGGFKCCGLRLSTPWCSGPRFEGHYPSRRNRTSVSPQLRASSCSKRGGSTTGVPAFSSRTQTAPGFSQFPSTRHASAFSPNPLP